MSKNNKVVYPNDVCPQANDGIHNPDWDSVMVTYDDDVYIYISCLFCGKSGCLGTSKTLVSGITW